MQRLSSKDPTYEFSLALKQARSFGSSDITFNSRDELILALGISGATVKFNAEDGSYSISGGGFGISCNGMGQCLGSISSTINWGPVSTMSTPDGKLVISSGVSGGVGGFSVSAKATATYVVDRQRLNNDVLRGIDNLLEPATGNRPLEEIIKTVDSIVY